MTRSTIAVLLAIVAGVAAMVVFMDADHPVLVLAGGLLALAVGLIVAVAS